MPVRFVLIGSLSPNDTAAGVEPFHVIGDFIEFDPEPPNDALEAEMQVSDFLHAPLPWKYNSGSRTPIKCIYHIQTQAVYY